MPVNVLTEELTSKLSRVKTLGHINHPTQLDCPVKNGIPSNPRLWSFTILKELNSFTVDKCCGDDLQVGQKTKE